jgi:hypothetical protein
VLVAGAATHLVAVALPPFLSYDPDYYAALARAMATFHQSPDTPLSISLRPNDPFFALLPQVWRGGTSGYGPLFNGLAWLVGRVGGDSLTAQLHLFQLLGLACMLATAFLVGRACEGERGSGARAAALVLFCPLAIVEGTMNAHVDALLAVSVAAYALAVVRGRSGLGFLALALGVAAKMSGALLLVFAGLERLLRPIASRVRAWHLALVGLPLCAALVALLVTYGYRPPLAATVLPLFGRPDEAYPHCTRSVECAPRAFLHLAQGWPRASWGVSLAFRLGAALFWLWAAWRAALERDRLRYAATALFVYYLYLHGFMQSWYLLSLLPLLPFASSRLRPAMETFCVSALVYYAVRQPTMCMEDHAVILAREIGEAAIVILPPSILLLRALRQPTEPPHDISK